MAASLTAITPAARADQIVSLQNVTLKDGGTASGYFVLNVYGYLQSWDITTTGSTLGNQTFVTGDPSSVTGHPNDTAFDFASPNYSVGLALIVTNPLGPNFQGSDALVPGTQTSGGPTGSAEVCSFASTYCAVAGADDLVTAGALHVPEPASAALLAAGLALLTPARRRNPC